MIRKFKTAIDLKNFYDQYRNKSNRTFPEKLFQRILEAFNILSDDPICDELIDLYNCLQYKNKDPMIIFDYIIDIISKMLELAHILLWKKCTKNTNDEIEEFQHDSFSDDIKRIKKATSKIKNSIKERINKAEKIIKEIEDIRGKIGLICEIFKSSKIKRPDIPSNFRLKGYSSSMDFLLKEHITKINNEIEGLKNFSKELNIRVKKWDPLTLIKIKNLLEKMEGFRKNTKAKVLLKIFIDTKIFPDVYYTSTENKREQLNKINNLLKRIEDNSSKLNFLQKHIYNFSTSCLTPNLNTWIKNFPK